MHKSWFSSLSNCGIKLIAFNNALRSIYSQLVLYKGWFRNIWIWCLIYVEFSGWGNALLKKISITCKVSSCKSQLGELETYVVTVERIHSFDYVLKISVFVSGNQNSSARNISILAIWSLLFQLPGGYWIIILGEYAWINFHWLPAYIFGCYRLMA